MLDQNPHKVACSHHKIDKDQTETEELDIDFRIPGLSHAVVKEAEHLRVQELVEKIEIHPHGEAFSCRLAR